MEREESTSRKWNIFAREMEIILARHGFRLGHLNDRAHIHPEKVRRLQRSLREPKFHVLSPEELGEVCRVFNLTREERIRLRAAILSTAIEEMLMNRINRDDALAAADQAMAILERSLNAQDGDESGIGAVKGSVLEATYADSTDQSLNGALDELDTALLLLHLSDAGSPANAIEYALRAQGAFALALRWLEQAPAGMRLSSAWLFWHAEVHNGLASVDRRLAVLNL